jgi:flagellar hook-basal body complex protein FliE
MAINGMGGAGAGLEAMRAYARAAQGALGQATSPEAVPGAGFGELVRSAVMSAERTTKAAETAMVNQVTGRGDLVDVVTAVAAAEATLETVVAVRDQVIQAYQDILRMPI